MGMTTDLSRYGKSADSGCSSRIQSPEKNIWA